MHTYTRLFYLRIEVKFFSSSLINKMPRVTCKSCEVRSAFTHGPRLFITRWKRKNVLTFGDVITHQNAFIVTWPVSHSIEYCKVLFYNASSQTNNLWVNEIAKILCEQYLFFSLNFYIFFLIHLSEKWLQNSKLWNLIMLTYSDSLLVISLFDELTLKCTCMTFQIYLSRFTHQILCRLKQNHRFMGTNG